MDALIPARGGSKGVPNKNQRLLGGIPLIGHTINAAKRSPRIDRIFVSTEDPALAEIAREWRVPVIERPADLAQDHSSMEEVVLHALSQLTPKPKYLALLQPTSPLRTAAHITAAVEAFEARQANSLMSVTQAEHHPMKALTLRQGFLHPLFAAEHLSKPRQLLPEALRQNGAIYLFRTALFEQKRSFFLEPVLPFEMPPENSVDIDSLQDLKYCEWLFTQLTD